MALHWNVDRCADREKFFYTTPDGYKKLRDVYENIVLLTAGVDIGEITEKNAVEFLTRLRVLERIDGCFIYRKDEEGKIVPSPFTYEQVSDMIGMHTNATTRSRAGFMKKIAQSIARDAERSASDSHKLWLIAKDAKGAQA